MGILYISNAYLPSNNINFWSEKNRSVYSISGIFYILQHWECTFLLKNFLFEVSPRKIRKFCIIFFLTRHWSNIWFSLFFRHRGKLHPDKKDISSPCGFEHIVSIGSRDYSKFFSLQTFVSARQFVKHKQKPRYGKSKWAPQPPKK